MGGVEGHGIGHVKPGSSGLHAVSVVAGNPRAGNGLDVARLVDLADAMVEGVGDVQVSVSVDGDAPRRVQEGRSGGPSIAAVAGRADSLSVHESDDRRDGTRGRGDLADNVIDAVCDVEVPCAVECNAGGSIERSAGGKPSVAGVCRVAVAGDGGYWPACAAEQTVPVIVAPRPPQTMRMRW